MHRIDGAGHVGNMFVTEDVATNRPPTEMTDTWLNSVQEEIARTIEATGMMLNPADFTQLLTAIRALNPHNMQIFTISGNFIVPPGITKVVAEVWGGGSGGSGGAGASGAGGGYALKSCAVTPGQVIPVTVGSGGASSVYPTNSGSGGTSSFGTFCSATGGSAVISVGPSGGFGIDGDVNMTGQSGSDLHSTSIFASGGNSPRGGSGGTVVQGGALQVCAPGLWPGGGGGAAYLTETSGGASNGANGAVLLFW